jgi:hypothetical protein
VRRFMRRDSRVKRSLRDDTLRSDVAYAPGRPIPDTSQVLQLQHAAGNRAVAEVLQRRVLARMSNTANLRKLSNEERVTAVSKLAEEAAEQLLASGEREAEKHYDGLYEEMYGLGDLNDAAFNAFCDKLDAAIAWINASKQAASEEKMQADEEKRKARQTPAQREKEEEEEARREEEKQTDRDRGEARYFVAVVMPAAIKGGQRTKRFPDTSLRSELEQLIKTINAALDAAGEWTEHTTMSDEQRRVSDRIERAFGDLCRRVRDLSGSSDPDDQGNITIISQSGLLAPIQAAAKASCNNILAQEMLKALGNIPK